MLYAGLPGNALLTVQFWEEKKVWHSNHTLLLHLLRSSTDGGATAAAAHFILLLIIERRAERRIRLALWSEQCRHFLSLSLSLKSITWANIWILISPYDELRDGANLICIWLELHRPSIKLTPYLFLYSLPLLCQFCPLTSGKWRLHSVFTPSLETVASFAQVNRTFFVSKLLCNQILDPSRH